MQYARGSVGALRKELAHFSPSLRYVRERRESIDMLGFATEIAEYYSSHWHGRGKNAGIDVTVIDESASPFMVRGNRGKLTQVLDNLLLNSGYWIDVAQKQGVVTDGRSPFAPPASASRYRQRPRRGAFGGKLAVRRLRYPQATRRRARAWAVHRAAAARERELTSTSDQIGTPTDAGTSL